MAHIFANGVLETSTLTGTGNVTLTGPVAGFRTFASKCAVGDTVHYRIEAVNGLGIPTGLWELGRGTYSATNTLTRTTVYESSNANALENFAGSVRVQITVLSPTTATQVALDWLSAMGAAPLNSPVFVGTGVYNNSGYFNATNASGSASVVLNKAAGAYSATYWGQRAGVTRWGIDLGSTAAEGTSNAGSDFGINRYDDAGAWLGTVMSVVRATGGITFGGVIQQTAPSGDTIYYINANTTALNAYFSFKHANTERWRWISESTSIDFALHRLNSSGAYQNAPIRVNNANGDITVNQGAGWFYAKNKVVIGPLASYMGASASSNSLELQNNGGTGDGNMAMMAFHCTGQYAIKLGLRPDGYFGLGSWSRATWSWYSAPNGDMTAAGNLIAYSDENLKTNWKDMPRNFVARLARVRVGVYDRIDTKLRQVGVGAQSLRKLLPWAITKGIDGKTLGVAYGQAALASAVELAKDNVALRKEIHEERKARRALERKMVRFEKMLKEAMKK